MGADRIFVLLQVTVVVLSIIAGVEYFKYGTKMSYEWFHCTPQVSLLPNTGITAVTATGGPSCDVRGQVKSITKKIAKEFDPNIEPVLFCIKQDDAQGVIGYAAHPDHEQLLSEYCSEIIHW